MRDPGELQVFPFRESVANLYRAVIMETDDITGYCALCLLAGTGHERDSITDAYILAESAVAQLHAFGVLAGTHPQKGYSVAMLGVHIGLDLEHKCAELRLVRLHQTRPRRARAGLRRPLHKVIEHFPNAKIT